VLPRLERKQAVKPLTHPITVAFGLANLYLLDLTGPLISPEHDLIHHLVGSSSSVIIPIIVYVITLSLLLTAPQRRGLTKISPPATAVSSTPAPVTSLSSLTSKPLLGIDQPFSAVSTRALLDALTQNHLQTPADLQTWASQKK